MAVDSSYVSRRVEKITYDEQGVIRQEADALDMHFFEPAGATMLPGCPRERV
jgi:hypothetical protein